MYKLIQNGQLIKEYYTRTEADAKRSITKLLNGDMGDEYRNDKFTIVAVDWLV